MSAEISEATRAARLTGGRGASGTGAAATGAAPAGCGVAGVFGWGVLEVGLLNIIAGLYETEGVLSGAVDPHFIVQVRAGGASGIAHGPDLLTENHVLTDSNGDARKVRI